MTPTGGAATPQGGTGAGRVLAAMILANAMILVDQTAVPLTLPAIMADFHVGAARAQWVLTASLLPLAGLLVLGGRLADLRGRRRIFLLGGVLFGTGSLVAGLAPTFEVLLGARVVQGVGGALVLPASVAIVGAAYPPSARGRALGTMGGIAAVAGALGPTLGGVLTSAVSWRAVLLINVPLMLLLVVATRRVPRDTVPTERPRVDVLGSVLMCVGLVAFVYGLSQSAVWGFASPGVLGPLAASVVAGAWFVVHERRTAEPLLDLALLRRSRNYRGATVSQGLAGMAEMGLGLIFPLLLILNLRIDPAVAGLALLPTTIPMILLATPAGRWYDRAGGRPPLVVGFLVLAVAGVALAIGVWATSYWALLPGLLVYGAGLSLVLTVNDPVSLDSIPESDHGQASGVSATAEQGGGAIGIALLYAVFHTSYLVRLEEEVARRGLSPLDAEAGAKLKDVVQTAEQVGLHPESVPQDTYAYLLAAGDASAWGYVITFAAVTLLALVGAWTSYRLVRRPAAAAAAAS